MLQILQIELVWESGNRLIRLNISGSNFPSIFNKANILKINKIISRNVILEKSKSIDETGYLVWQLAVALFLSWLIVYLMVLNGIKV